MHIMALLTLARRYFWLFVRMLDMKPNCTLLLLYETPASPDVMGRSRPVLEIAQIFGETVNAEFLVL